MHPPALLAHLPTSLPAPRLIPTSDDDMFISLPSDLTRAVAPLSGPWWPVADGSNSRTGGGFAVKYTHPHQCKGCEAKGRERIALSGHLRSRVSKVPAQDKEAGVTHQGATGRRNARRDQEMPPRSYEGQSLVLPGMHRAGVGLRRMGVVWSAWSEADGGTTSGQIRELDGGCQERAPTPASSFHLKRQEALRKDVIVEQLAGAAPVLRHFSLKCHWGRRGSFAVSTLM